MRKNNKRDDYVKKVVQHFYDTKANNRGGQGNTGKSCNDKKGNLQHPAGMDVRKRST